MGRNFRSTTRKGPRALGELAPSLIDNATAKLGFGESDIVLHWADIAGERLAPVSQPEKLQWPVRPKNPPAETAPEPAALILKVEGAFAIEVQHLAPVLIERINARLGWRCVARILIRQGPVRRRAAGRAKAAPPSPQAREAAEQATRGIQPENLRAALNRLGARALTGKDAGKAQESD